LEVLFASQFHQPKLNSLINFHDYLFIDKNLLQEDQDLILDEIEYCCQLGHTDFENLATKLTTLKS